MSSRIDRANDLDVVKATVVPPEGVEGVDVLRGLDDVRTNELTDVALLNESDVARHVAPAPRSVRMRQVGGGVPDLQHYLAS